MEKYALTLVKSPQDERDWHYGDIVKMANIGVLPKRASLRRYCERIRDQGAAGFCHSFAGTALKNAQETMERGYRLYDFSPLGLARAVKARDGIVYTEGSTLLHVCRALCEDGVFDEVYYPYELYEAGTLKFPRMKVKAEEEEKIPKYFCENYARVDELNELKKAISEGKPVLIGITCSEEIYEPTEGCIGLPLGSFIIGGHAMLAVGYDDEKEMTIRGRRYKGFVECQNSWGEDHGDKGFLWIPYEYFTYRTKDFGMGFVMDMYTAVDLKKEDLNGTALELFLESETAYDDGREVMLEQKAIADTRTGRTLVPLRFVGEALGCSVEWLTKSRRIIIRRDKTFIQLAVGERMALVDGAARLMEQAPVIDERTDRALIPLRFVAETLGNTVLWDGKRRKITILKR